MAKWTRVLSIVALVLCILSGMIFAGGRQEKSIASGDTKNSTGNRKVDFEKISVNYAQGFSVEYFDTYKLVTIHKPWQGATEDFRYILVQRGFEVPNEYENAQRIEVPIRKIVTMSTTYVTYLEMLGELDSLVGHESFLFTMNEKLLEMAAAGKVKETGSGPQVNVELIMELDPDLVMTHAIGGEWDTHPKLFEAGLHVAINGEHLETTPLGRFEWIKFLALFYNKEKEANAIFEETREAYKNLTDKVPVNAEKPTVFVNSPYQGTWWIPGGESFQARFIEDAGGDYLWSDENSTGALMLDIEAVFEKASNADIWINPGMWSSLAEAKAEDERFTEFTAYQKGAVYNNNRMENENGGNAYWEYGVAKPHVVLADLIKIFHPEILPDHEFVYYHKLR